MPDEAPSCAEELRRLYDAVMALQTGERAVTISFGGRSVTYQQNQLKGLMQLGRHFWKVCGPESGLVNIFTDAAAAERGPPVRVRNWT